jgi:hypothetical protein
VVKRIVEMSIDIDNVVYKMVESLDFDEQIFLANKLDVEHDEGSWLDDMYPQKMEELKEQIEDALRKFLKPSNPEILAKKAADTGEPKDFVRLS